MLSRFRRAIGKMIATQAPAIEAVVNFPDLPGCWTQVDETHQLWGYVALRISLPTNQDRIKRFVRELGKLPVTCIKLGIYSQAISQENLDDWESSQYAGQPLTQALASARRQFLAEAGLRSRLGFLVVQTPLTNNLEAEPQLGELFNQLTNQAQAVGARFTPFTDDHAMFTFKEVPAKNSDEYADFTITGSRLSSLGLHLALKELDSNRFTGAYKAILTLVPESPGNTTVRANCMVRLYCPDLHRTAHQFDAVMRKRNLTSTQMIAVARATWPAAKTVERWPVQSLEELLNLAPIQERVSCQKLSQGGIPLISTSGEARSFNPFQAVRSHNTLICGSAGTGKHFIASELLARHFMLKDSDGFSWVLDSAGNYTRLADALGACVVPLTAQDGVLDLLTLVSSKESLESHQGILVQWLCQLANADVASHAMMMLRAMKQALQSSPAGLTLTAVRLTLESGMDPTAKKLAAALATVEKEMAFLPDIGIPYAPLTVFDLSQLDRTRQAIAAQTLLLQIQLYWQQTTSLNHKKKLILVDNPCLFPNQELLVQSMRTCRKQNAGFLLISSLGDVVPGGRWDQVLSQLNYLMLQRSLPEDIERYIAHVQLPDEYAHTLRRLSEAADRQSDLMLFDAQYGECAKFFFRVDKLAHALYNTRSRHKAKYTLRRQTGDSPLKALEACV